MTVFFYHDSIYDYSHPCMQVTFIDFKLYKINTTYCITHLLSAFNLYSNVVFPATSCATIPVTIDNLNQKSSIDPRVVKFMIPVGATVNMNGAALFIAVSAIFIAQINVQLGLIHPLTIVNYVVVR